MVLSGRDSGFYLSGATRSSPIPPYHSIYDKHLTTYFRENGNARRILAKDSLVVKHENQLEKKRGSGFM